KFRVRPTVIDIGLRLADVRTMGVATKPVAYKSQVDPGENLRARGGDGGGGRLPGPRRRAGQLARREVELKAMTSAQFVGFIERKFPEHGVGKVVPTGEALATAFRRAVRIREAQDAIDRATAELPALEAGALPEGLEGRLREMVERT